MGKYRGLWVQPERQETLLVIVQALGWDFERQMIQRGSCRLVPNETFLCKHVPLKVDQHEQLRMSVPSERCVELSYRQESDRGFTTRFRFRPVLVTRLAQQRKPEHLLVEVTHSRQIADTEDNLGHTHDRASRRPAGRARHRVDPGAHQGHTESDS